MKKTHKAMLRGKTQSILRILNVHDQFRWSLVLYAEHRKMVIPQLTTFDPEDGGEMVQGVDFHKQQFEKGIY